MATSESYIGSHPSSFVTFTDKELFKVDNSTETTSATTDLPEEYTHWQLPWYQQFIFITLYCFIILLAVGGNAIVCYIVIRSPRMRTVTNFFIVSLAISDILMAVLCVPFTFVAVVILNDWPFGSVMCPVVIFTQVVAVFLSSFTMVAISIDRYLAIIYPLRPKTTKRHALMAIGTIWCLSGLIPLPTAITARTRSYDNNTAHVLCREKWELDNMQLVYSLTIMTLQYFLPLMIFVFTYGRIIIVMWIKTTPGEAETTRDQRMAESKKKIIKMMITVVVMYAICWLPLHIVTIIGDRNPKIYDKPYMNIAWIVFHGLAMSNSVYNPIIYCWMNSKFRIGFLKVFNCFTCGLVRVHDGAEMQRMRRQETVTTSVRSTSTRRIFTTSSREKFSYEDIPLQGAKNRC